MNDSASTTPDLASTTADEPQFVVVAMRKLIIMNFLTLGLYSWFCFYRSWVLHRNGTGERILPLVRALFMALFFYSLLKRVERKIHDSGRAYRWSPAWLTVVYIAASIILAMLDPSVWLFYPNAAMLIFLASYAMFLWTIAKVQHAINFCEEDEAGRSNATFSVANWAWMALGTLLWLSLLVVFVTVYRQGVY